MGLFLLLFRLFVDLMSSPLFIKPRKSEWISKVSSDLKTEDIHQLLDWEPFKNILANAYYDLSDKDSCKEVTNFFSSLRYAEWQLLELVKVEDAEKANQQALASLNLGATGVLFHTDQPIENINRLWQEIDPSYCFVAFSGKEADLFSNRFFKIFSEEKKNPYGFVENGKKYQASNHFKSIGLIIESQFDIIPVLKNYLIELEKLRHIFGDPFLDHLNVSIILDQKFYQSIALCRVVRWLTYLYSCSEGISLEASIFHIHCSIKTSGDYKKDMLTNTSSGLAAILGGANSISFELNSDKGYDFDQRIARNIGNLLRDESHLAMEKDAVTGSYFLDYLTNELSERAWNAFTKES